MMLALSIAATLGGYLAFGGFLAKMDGQSFHKGVLVAAWVASVFVILIALIGVSFMV